MIKTQISYHYMHPFHIVPLLDSYQHVRALRLIT